LPDRSLTDTDCCANHFRIEHWGIDENDPDKSINPEWNQTWDDYRDNMETKRKVYNEQGIVLLETAISDMKAGREKFEEKLCSLLVMIGVICNKLPKQELIKRLVERQRSRIIDLFIQYIQKAKINGISVLDLNP